MPSKKIILPVVLVFILAVSAWMFIGECSFFAGMGASLTECECSGYELLLYDRTAADGPRKSICVGWIKSVKCYQYLDGPTVECEV